MDKVIPIYPSNFVCGKYNDFTAPKMGYLKKPSTPRGNNQSEGLLYKKNSFNFSFNKCDHKLKS